MSQDIKFSPLLQDKADSDVDGRQADSDAQNLDEVCIVQNVIWQICMCYNISDNYQ